MNLRLRGVIVVLTLAGVLADGPRLALAGGWCKPCCCDRTCPTASCRPAIKAQTVKKECFEVECRHLCIPAITFPWDKCPAPRCGKVIHVNTLKRCSYDSGETCVVEWSVECPCSACGQYRAGGDCKAGAAAAAPPAVRSPHGRGKNGEAHARLR